MDHRPLVTLLALLTLAPIAAAGWGAKGAYEPDTRYDTTSGFMRTAPDWAVAGSKVYFNGFQATSNAATGSGLNPNSAVVGTYHIVTPFRPYAMLGVWKDCNKDGFVGFGDQGLFEYPAQLLGVPGADAAVPGTSVCPPQTVPTPIPRDWKPVHNDGQWVHELLPLGWEANGYCNGCVDANPWNLADNGAKVWADWGVPGSPPGYICYITSHPRGSFDDTGSMLDLADCTARQRIANAMAQHPEGAPAWDLARGVENPWGRDSGASLATGFDCSSPLVPTTRVGTTELHVTVPRVGTPSANPDGSVGGTLNETETQFGDCNYTDEDSTSVKKLPYSTETDIHNQYGQKSVNEFVLRFSEGCRVNPIAQVPNCSPGALGRGAPGDLGLRLHDTQGFWAANALVVFGRNPFVSPDGDGVQKVQHISYYAYVSTASKYGLDLPRAAARYGAVPCTTIGAGALLTGSWECDPAKWWVPTGDPAADAIGFANVAGQSQVFVGAKVGDDYNMLDVDCYDEGTRDLRNEGIGWGLVSGTTCQ